MSCTKEKYVKTALGFVGTTEHPPGSNINAITEEFGLPGSAWCDQKISVAGKHAGARDIIGWFAFTPSHAKWFNAQGHFHHGTDGIQVGDIIFFAFYGPNYEGRWLGICHVGVVIGIKADGRLVVDEGNHNNADQIVVRSRTHIAGYGRPDYDQPVAPTPAPAKPKPARKPAPKPVPPTLRMKSRGNWVKVLERKVGATVDKKTGIFGPDVLSHVLHFQKTHGLVEDGVVGPKTWAKLGY